MIHKETFEQNGTQYTRTYSDRYYITLNDAGRDGVEKTEAVDQTEYNRTYEETSRELENPIVATESDYIEALQDLGVDVDA